MKKVIIPALLLSALFTTQTQAQTVFEALSDAYNTNPTLQAQRAYLRAVDENVAIAKSGFRPTLALRGSYSDTDVSHDNLGQKNDGKSSNASAVVTQPLFNGLSTLNSVKAADKTVKAEQKNLSNVEQSVFLDASTAYFNVVQNAAIVELQRNNEKLLKRKLDETTERFNVGDVTRTDVSQARARYAAAQASTISAEGDLEASKAIYRQVIGSEPKTLSEPKNLSKYIPNNFNDALAYAKEHNFAVLAAKDTLSAKDYTVSANTGALLPQVSLEGSANSGRNDSEIPASKDHKQDYYAVGVNMTVPLYDAGENRAKIRQSKYQKWQAQELLLNAERQAVSDITKAWEYMAANHARIKSIKEQIKANKIALDGVQKEEMLGNRTILDVLDAYNELLTSQVNEVKARRDYFVSGMQVLSAMGKLTANDLNLAVDIYDAEKYYKETKGKWLSLSVD
ncbi:MAG: TolC family outer membrane protein [Alphaproteobacteria bacterium]|nr:TolC family outer membrane protein [Alphaproteobacteria bacterium]